MNSNGFNQNAGWFRSLEVVLTMREQSYLFLGETEQNYRILLYGSWTGIQTKSDLPIQKLGISLSEFVLEDTE
jgi:hypothetical protein